MDDALYRLNVGIVLKNAQGKIFVGQRIDAALEGNIAWQMPQGGIDEGETLEEAVMRELLEEIGTDKVRIVRVTKEWLYYDLPEDLQALQVKNWGRIYKGQKQRWFLMDFLGEDSDINLNTAHPEFLSSAWITPREALACAAPFKHAIYQKVFREFGFF